MALLESLTLALGTGIVKYLVKEVLSTELQDQISEELVDLGINLVTGKRQESDPVSLAIGKRIDAIYQSSTIEENARIAVVLEVTRTLALANTKPVHLVELDLEVARLFQELVEIRPEATTHLSQNEEELYRRMLKVASEGIIEASAESIGFIRAVSWGLLRGQSNLTEGFSRLERMQEKLWSGLAKLVTEPEEKVQAAEEKYRLHLVERLDRMEPFGIPQRDDIGQRLKLQDAFVKLKLTPRSTNKELAKELEQWRNKLSHQSSMQPDLFESLDESDEEMNSEKRIGQWVRSFTGYMTNTNALQSLSFLFDSPTSDSEFLDEVLAPERRVMIEGLAGSGKSTILQWMAVKAAQGHFPEAMSSWNGLVPFFIRLRQCRGGGFPAPDMWPHLEAKQIAGRLPQGWVHELLEKGRALVLVDGVDEMPLSQRDDMLKELRSLVHDYPLARYVVTSRPTAISEKQWPEWRLWLRESGFVETGVKELEGGQLDLFVDQWHDALWQSVVEEDRKDKAQRNAANLKQLLRRRTDLRKLATTPLLGAMICALYQEREDKVPRERLKLYEECVEMLLERREEKKGVNLDADYVDLSYSQKLILLQSLAYWMLDNAYSAASVGDVEAQLANRLPALDLRNISGQEVRRLFVERTGLLQEAIVDEISFRHRTFQEFLAAREAIKNNNIGVLVKNVRDDQWRETIILAVGFARPDERTKLLRGVLKRAATLKTAKHRHQVYLLALACLETCTELDPAIRQEVVTAAHSVFPPHNQDEVTQIAKAGDYAVDLLSYDPDYPEEIAVLCIKTLAEIGGEFALAKLVDFRVDERFAVQNALENSWSRFEAKTFVEKILYDKQKLALAEMPLHENWSQLVPWLTQLDLGWISVSDISPLANLAKLSHLELSGKNINDISPLANLVNLSHLELRGEKINDISPLANLANLSHLKLRGEKINDISPLANLANLSHLELSGENINDISPLANLANLSHLELSGKNISDISSLANLANLSQLILHEQQISNLSWSDMFSSLTHLSIGANVSWGLDTGFSIAFGNAKGTDIAVLPRLPNISQLNLVMKDGLELPRMPRLSSLSQLFLSGTGIRDLSGLVNLPNISQLLLYDTNVNDLIPLANLHNLSKLYLYGLGASDISPLAKLSNLSELYFRENNICDISPLATLTNLSQLHLSGDKISDILPLANLTNLSQLHLSGDKISDISPLANLTNLSQLHLSGDKISDISPLANLTNLSQLCLSGKNIIDLSSIAKMPVLNQLGVGAIIYVDREEQVVHISSNRPTSVKNFRQLLMQLPLRILALHESMSIPDLDVLQRERGLAIYGGRRGALYRYVPPTKLT